MTTINKRRNPREVAEALAKKEGVDYGVTLLLVENVKGAFGARATVRRNVKVESIDPRDGSEVIGPEDVEVLVRNLDTNRRSTIRLDGLLRMVAAGKS